MGLKWQWTIPNVLSLMRVALIPVFAVLYLKSGEQPSLLWWAVGALVLSGITDMFDGMIARKLNQVTDIGKLLDPFADKLTQVTVILCLAIRLPQLWPMLGVCFLKELLQTIGSGLLLFRAKAKVQSSRWYGKISTFVFYVAMAAFVAFPMEGDGDPLLFGWHMPAWMFTALVILVVVCMAFAFLQYARLFVQVSHETRREREQEVSPLDGHENA
ncbi:MAG: CDP-alcohol phosphatidyltransferase family protein [Clostridia bacterium]|nr:CDP-alcohol phosphatidyltransferase family protein [Clostridia bacterium]